jgi:DNA-binding response OmpR family regulator
MGAKILIVDDEPSMLKMLGLSLEKEGYEISAAQDGQQALARVETSRPDLMILDVMMPGMDGLELCRRLRERAETATVPIILLSAKGQVPDKVAGLQAGADEYVVKPVDTAELHARVASLLERTERLRGEQTPKAGKVISFLGAKGGVGTTTTLLNVGVAMALKKRRVFAVELRSSPGSFGVILGMPGTGGIEGLLGVDPRAITAQEVGRRLAHHASGLEALCAPDRIVVDRDLDEVQSELILDRLAATADVVLVDLPSQPSRASRAAVQRSQQIVLVVEPVTDCIAAGVVQADYLRSIVGAGTALSLVVVNRSAIASPIAPRDLQEQLGLSIVGTIPPAADECARAQLLGRPIIQSQPEALVSQAFKSLKDVLA